MNNYEYKQIDSLLHSRIRLSVMAMLSACEESDFVTIKKSIGASDGNLNTHLRKLEDAEYVLMNKQFVGRKPITMYKLSPKGIKAFYDYIENLKKIIGE